MTGDPASDAALRASGVDWHTLAFTQDGVQLTLHLSTASQLPPDACVLLIADAAFRPALARRYGPDATCTPLQKNVNLIAPWTEGLLTVSARLLKTGRRLAVGEAFISRGETTVAHVTATYRMT